MRQQEGWTATLSEELALCLVQGTAKARALKSVVMYLHKLRLSVSFVLTLGVLVEGLPGELKGADPSPRSV